MVWVSIVAGIFIGVCAMLMIDRQFIYKAQTDDINALRDQLREIHLQLQYFDLKTEDWEPQSLHVPKTGDVVSVFFDHRKKAA